MKSNLKGYTIQNNVEDFSKILVRINKESSSNILYYNCRCYFKIGDNSIRTRIFDKCFYSEDSDTVIFFAKGKITKDEIEKTLEENNIRYTIVRFDWKDKEFIDYDYIKDIYFATDENSFTRAINDSLNKGVNSCLYDENEQSELSIGYKTNAENREYCEIEGKSCRGVITLADKIILLVDHKEKRNLNPREVKSILKRKGIKIETINKSR